MQFTNPTTKAQMYSVLQDIFYYYRIRRESWGGIELQPLSIPRLSFTASTTAELVSSAHKLVTPSLRLREYESIEKLVLAKSQLTIKKANLDEKIEQTESAIIALYQKQEEEITKKVLKLGTVNSTIETTEINKIQTKKNEELTKARQEHAQFVSAIEGEITALENRISQAETFFAGILEKEVSKKVEELRAEEKKRQEEVNKYNNHAAEKELRYSNDILVKQANLDIKYRELSQVFFTKDQLIEMGYYKDVINCICAYYNTLAPLTAYQDFMNETRVMIYLEDYYSDVLYMYRARAGQ